MFNAIVVPLDAEEPSEYAVPLATALASRLGDRLVLLSVVPEIEEPSAFTGEHGPAMGSLQKQRVTEAEHYLHEVIARSVGGDLEVSHTVHAGPVAETILKTARDEEAGLIAMATHGRVGPERWFLGSVADRVVHTSPVPVLLVRPGEAGAGAPPPPPGRPGPPRRLAGCGGSPAPGDRSCRSM